ncbi:MAG: hypothetical protein M1835_006638 [Candelina submexicana]|nr:MAG: hypothetical protein M1835_006638 [Candelina submexicana]
MASSVPSLKLPKIDRESFLTGKYTIVTYSHGTQSANPGVVVRKEDVFEGFELRVKKLFRNSPSRLTKLLDQLQCPEAWIHWNTLETPSRGFFGVDNQILFLCVRPRLAYEKKTGRIKMIKGMGYPSICADIFAPFFGLRSLQRVTYKEIWDTTLVSMYLDGNWLTPEELLQFHEEGKLRHVIDNVYMGIIYNEFHFMSPEEQYKAYIFGFRGSRFEPRRGMNLRKPPGMEEPILYPIIEEQHPPADEFPQAESSTAEQHDSKINTKRGLETDDEDHKNPKAQKITAEDDEPHFTTEQGAADIILEAPTAESLQEEVARLRADNACLQEQLQAAAASEREQQQQQRCAAYENPEGGLYTLLHTTLSDDEHVRAIVAHLLKLSGDRHEAVVAPLVHSLLEETGHSFEKVEDIFTEYLLKHSNDDDDDH